MDHVEFSRLYKEQHGEDAPPGVILHAKAPLRRGSAYENTLGEWEVISHPVQVGDRVLSIIALLTEDGEYLTTVRVVRKNA